MLVSARLCALISLLAACAPVGGTRGVVLGPDEETRLQRCREAQGMQLSPLFAPGPSETGPVITTRADGTRVTTVAGRFRTRHEREASTAGYPARSYENRSYQLIIEDGTPAGRSELKLTYLPNADASTGLSTQFRAWKVWGPAGDLGGGYTFADNSMMAVRGPRQLEKTITANTREGRPLRTGDLFDFELGLALAGADAADLNPIEGPRVGFSDTFRYRVGDGGLTPETFDFVGLVGPPAAAWLGGGTTVPYVALADGTAIAPALSFSQLALNAQAPHAQDFLEGRRLFFTELDSGAHLEPGNPPFAAAAGALGPRFQAKSCEACHALNGRGVLPAVGQRTLSLALKLNASAGQGAWLQPQDAPVTLARFESSQVQLADGTTVALQRPVFETGLALAPSARLAPALVGMGLLEAVDEAAVLAVADPTDCDGDGISGRARSVGGRLGRFGWKAELPSLEALVSDELGARHGVTSTGLPTTQLRTYLRLLGVQPQRSSTTATVRRGAALFTSTGCAACHLPSLASGSTHPLEELRAQAAQPYTDLLLHDLGAGLADSSGTEEAAEWRTAPLWGIGLTAQVSGQLALLHDGRARSVLEAVLWHGGEAQRARDAVIAFPTADREALLRFIESL